MSQRFRRLFYYLFFFGFLISAPLVVLYTAGYRYNPTLGKIVKTGVVSVTTFPKNANVYLDGQQVKGQTPVVIDDIFPGEHTVRVTKDEYSSWEKTLEVESNLTTFAEDIILFLTTPETALTDLNAEQWVIHPNKEELAYIETTDSFKELWRFDLETLEPTVLARITTTETTELTWSPTGKHLLLSEVTANNQTIFSLDSTDTLSLSTFFRSTDNLWWDMSDDNKLYVQVDGLVYLVSVKEQTVVPLFALDGTLTSIVDGYYVAEEISGRTTVSYREEDETDILAYLPHGNYQFKSQNGKALLIEEVNRGRIVLVDTQSADQPILLNVDATMFEWSGDNQLVYSNGFDLHIYDLNTHTNTTLLRTSDEITDIAWYPINTHLLYAQRGNIYAIELDSRDERIITTLAEDTSTEHFWTDKDGDLLFYLSEKNDTTSLFEKLLQ